MVTKMADKIGLKERNCHFRPNLSLMETDFLRIRYQANTKKTFYYIVCSDNSHNLLKYFFLVFACALY